MTWTETNPSTECLNALGTVPTIVKPSDSHNAMARTFVATTALPVGAATITDVAMDPDDSTQVFAIDDNQVFRSINSGGTWTDITGKFSRFSS